MNRPGSEQPNPSLPTVVRASPSDDLACHPQLDLLVHALAQLPASIRLELPIRESSRIMDLAQAYGTQDRIEYGGIRRSGPAGVVDVDLGTGADPAARASRGLGWAVDDGKEGSRRRIGTFADLIDALDDGLAPCAGTAPFDPEPLASERIAVLTNVPNHYRVPLWNALSERLRERGAELRIFFTIGPAAATRHWVRHAEIEFDHSFVRIGPGGLPLDLARRLREFAPTLVLAGGFSVATLGALRFAREAGAVFGIWSGDTHRQASARGVLRRHERKWVLNRTDFAIAYGSLAVEYLRALAPQLPVVIGRNSAPILTEPAVGSNGSTVELLSVGQAIPRKGLDLLIGAVRSLDRDLPCRLTIVGGGPELPDLIARGGGDGRIRLLGAVESDRVLACYREADAFLFPSRSDVFGLVLVEALGSGLPTITSAAPAGVFDLAVGGRNCMVVDSPTPASWAEGIGELVMGPGLRATLGEMGRRTVLRRWTIEHSVDAWLAGLRLGALRRGQGGLQRGV